MTNNRRELPTDVAEAVIGIRQALNEVESIAEIIRAHRETLVLCSPGPGKVYGAEASTTTESLFRLLTDLSVVRDLDDEAIAQRLTELGRLKKFWMAAKLLGELNRPTSRSPEACLDIEMTRLKCHLGGIDIVEEAIGPRLHKRQRQALELLRTYGPLTAEDISRLGKFPNSGTYRGLMKKLQDMGRVTKDGEKYVLVPCLEKSDQT